MQRPLCFMKIINVSLILLVVPTLSTSLSINYRRFNSSVLADGFNLVKEFTVKSISSCAHEAMALQNTLKSAVFQFDNGVCKVGALSTDDLLAIHANRAFLGHDVPTGPDDIYGCKSLIKGTKNVKRCPDQSWFDTSCFGLDFCYQFHPLDNDNNSFYLAEKICNEHKGSLFLAESLEEQLLFNKLVRSNPELNRVKYWWNGMIRSNEVNLRIADGKPVEFTYWMSGWAPYYDGCSDMPSYRDFTWGIYHCGNRNHYFGAPCKIY